MSYTPKIPSSESVCFEGSIFRKCYRGTYVPKFLLSDRWSDGVMFDDPMALRSDWHDSTALGKYLLSHQYVTAVFAGWSFRTVWNKNISIQMSIQSINDEWWVYIIMDPHYSNNNFVYGTTHETGHKQPKFVSSGNAHYSFLNLKNIKKACIIYQSEIDI